MRALVLSPALSLLALGACTPEIVSGAYLCGPEAACPEGLACSPDSALCVSPGAVQAFSCGEDQTEVEPNNSVSTAQVVQALGCASALAEVGGCTPAGDGDDWFTFTVPSTCTTVVAKLRLSSSIAFQTLGVTLAGPNGSFEASAQACEAGFPDDGEVQVCLSQAVTPGATYTVHVGPSGAANCQGGCPYNRYRLGMQLATN